MRNAKKNQASRVTAVRPSRQVESWYRGELLAIVKAYRAAVSSRVLPLLDQVLATKATVQQLTEIIDKLDTAVPDTGRISQTLVKKSDAQVVTRLTGMIDRSFGIDLAGFLRGSPELKAVIDAATETNVSLIKSLPNQYLERVKTSAMTAVTQGLRFETVRDDILASGGITERRAKMIARDQVAKLNSSINRVRQQDLGITQYKWSTSGDERVRQTHRDNDGKIFDWSEPPVETGHPGDDYQCRCVAIPIINLEEDDGN